MSVKIIFGFSPYDKSVRESLPDIGMRYLQKNDVCMSRLVLTLNKPRG